MRMALEFCGIKKPEKQIAKWLKTNTVRGTWPKNFMAVAERLKLNHMTMRNGTFADLKKFQKEGFTILVCYYIPAEKIDHYTVLKKMDKEFIYFWDPYFGPNHNYRLAHFLKIWKSDPKFAQENGWFFGVKRADA